MTTTADDFTDLIGVHENVPATTYHSVRAVSSSFLKAFIGKSPAHAKAVLDGMTSPDDEDAEGALMIGTAAHAATLEPAEYDRTYVVGPEAARNTTAWKDFAADQPEGLICLKPSEAAVIDGIRSSVHGHPIASRLLDACDRRELSIFWRQNGIPCKARIDLYSSLKTCLVDLKTAASAAPDDFEKASYKFGYHIQFPWYVHALAQFDIPCSSVGLVVVEKLPPYAVVVYEPGVNWFSVGERKIVEAMGRLPSLWERDEWPGYSDSILQLNLPAWARG